MKHPWVNTLLSGFVPLALVSGFFAMTNGSPGKAWIVWLHAATAWAIAILLFWKSSAVLRSFQRRPRGVSTQRTLFVTLALLLLIALAPGFASAFAGHLVVLGYPFMTLHVSAALLLIPLFALHLTSMRFVFRVTESRNRRAFLRLAGAGVAGVAVWQLSVISQRLLDLPGASRRFTGSTEIGSFSGRFPFVTWLFDQQEPIDGASWRLRVDGAVDRPLELGLDELATLTASEERSALLDCTGGWHSEQRWGGVPIGLLLERAGVHGGAGSVTFVSATGYNRRFSLGEARGALLALSVAGEELDDGHGYPARLVMPDHRGFDWVKWVTRITVNRGSDFWQAPVPLQ